MYTTVWGALKLLVLGALGVRSGGGGLSFVNTLKQSFRCVSTRKGFRVWVDSLVLGLYAGPTSSGVGEVKNSGGWAAAGFHFSFMDASSLATLSMHLFGRAQELWVVRLIVVHLSHLQFLFLLWLFRMLRARVVMSARVRTLCLFLRHLPNLSHSVSGFSDSIVWLLRMAGRSRCRTWA